MTVRFIIIALASVLTAACGVPRTLYHTSVTGSPDAVIDSLNAAHGTRFAEWRDWNSQSLITNDSTLVISYVATERHADTLYVMTVVHSFNDSLVTVRFRRE